MPRSSEPPSPAPERLSLSLKLAFGSPAFAGAAMGIPIGVLMPRFYSDVVLAPLGAIAIAIAVARAFDALTDPVMGWISDHTRTRFGRRKPYIACAVPFTALAFYALFAPPAGLSPTGASLWFGASFALFFLFATVAEIPYAALGAEITPDYNERSSLFGYRSLFIATGTIVAALLPSILPAVPGLADERTLYAVMAALYGGVMIVLNVVLLWRVPERRDYVERESNPLVPGIRRALRNRPFRILLMAGIVSAIPAAVPAILLPYYVRYVLQPVDHATLVGIFLAVYLGAGLLFVPLWMAVAVRLGKLRTLILTSSTGIFASVFFFLPGPGDLWLAGAVYFMTGTVSMSGNFLVPAMAADVIDYDELRTGKRREAQYTSFWALIPKFVAIPGSSVPLAILAAVGYVPNQPQNEPVLLAIRIMYSLFPASFYVAAVWIVSRYPISEGIHEEIRRDIAARARGAEVVDPLTREILLPSGRRAVSETDGWFLDHFSPAELRWALNGGGAHLVWRVAAAAGAALACFAAAATVASTGFSTLDAQPPVRTVVAVVAAGLSLAASAFHLMRLAPARRMARQPLPEAVIRAHLGEPAEAEQSAR